MELEKDKPRFSKTNVHTCLRSMICRMKKRGKILAAIDERVPSLKVTRKQYKTGPSVQFYALAPPSPSPSSSIVLHFSWRIDFRVKITSVFPDQSKHFCSFSHAKHEIDRYACISKNRGREGRGNSVTKEKGNSICKRTSRTVALLCLQKYGNKENLKEEKKKRGISEILSTFG